MCLPFLFCIVLEVLSREVSEEKKVKQIQIGKENDKLALFVDKLVLYRKNAKHWMRKLLYLINAFSKMAGYKINVLNQ